MTTLAEQNQQIILAAISTTGARPRQPIRVRYNPADFGTPEEHQEKQAAANKAYQTEMDRYDAETAAYDQELKANARAIKVMLTPNPKDRGSVYNQLSAMEKAINPELDGGKVFAATVVDVWKEPTSKRGIIYLYAGGTGKPGKDPRTKTDLPQGYEIVRTERSDDPDGAAMGRRAQGLIGHRVTVYVELQPVKDDPNTKVRVLVHVEDKGNDTRYNATTKTVDA